MSTSRNPYPSDVIEEEWAFAAPYLTLMVLDAPQRTHALREVCNALRGLVRPGAMWRYLPHDVPLWEAVSQQAQRGIAAGCFADLAHDLRALLREAAGRDPAPTAAILDGRTRQSTPESGHRAGFDGHQKRKGSTIHAAVDPLGPLLARPVTPANAQERAQVADLAEAGQEATGNPVQLAGVDQGDTGEEPAEAAEASGIELAVGKLPEAKNGFVVLPRRWVGERSFAWASRFRRLAKDDERLPETVRGLHFLAFACLMLHRAAGALAASPLQALDTGPLGIIPNPKATPTNEAGRRWLRSMLVSGVEVIMPEIADYEVRRELLRASRTAGLRRLDTLKGVGGISYLPLTTATMIRAAELWARTRRRGNPLADPKELDGDVILAAQAESVSSVGDDLVVATTNVGHLSLLIPAERWQDIVP